MTTLHDITEDGVRTIVTDPGNGSRYIIVISKLPARVCQLLGSEEGSFLVAIPNHKSRTLLFTPKNGVDPVYLREKLDLSWGDANVLTLILNSLSWGDPQS